MQCIPRQIRRSHHGIDHSSGSSIRVAPRAVWRLWRAVCAETLVAALVELEREYDLAKNDAAFQAELAGLLKDYAGRPTPLYFCKRLTEQLGGAKIYLKREDLLHTGAHKINNALGQGLLARRMGKKRIIAETGAGQHGVATATVCALLGLECVVYMGDVDMERQEFERASYAPSWRRGPRGFVRIEDAERRHQRGNARLGHQRPDDVLSAGQCARSAPGIPRWCATFTAASAAR